MRILTLALFALSFLMVSCGDDDDCRSCTGTVTNTGNMADWTVCRDGDDVLQTNNLTGESMQTNNDFAGSVAFLEELGLTCED